MERPDEAIYFIQCGASESSIDRDELARKQCQQILDYIAHLEALTSWQPIETAPKDDQMLMLRMPDGQYWWGKWKGLTEIGLDGYWKVNGWRKHELPKPTHWRLPPSPPPALPHPESEAG